MNICVPKEYQIPTSNSTSFIYNDAKKFDKIRNLFLKKDEHSIKNIEYKISESILNKLPYDANYWTIILLLKTNVDHIFAFFLLWYFININIRGIQIINYLKDKLTIFKDIKKLYRGRIKEIPRFSS